MLDGDPRLARLRSSVIDAVNGTFGARCVALYAYGSGVDGSFIPGFSDFDLAVFTRGRPSLDDALALHRHLAEAELDPFAYLQVKYVNLSQPSKGEFVPGSYELLTGKLDDESVHVFDDEALRVEAERWLSVLPGLVVDDTHTWSVAVGSSRRQRHVRLIVTRIKPTVRSILAVSGVLPSAAFVANWDELAEYMDSRGAESAVLLRELREQSPLP